jgi:hypothetical protein
VSSLRPGALRDAVDVGFREWRTVAVLLSANWAVAGLMIAPMIPGVLDAYGHAPLAVGRPLVSTELLLGLGPMVTRGAMPSILAPLLLLAVLQTLLAGGVVWRACAGGPFRLGAFLGQSGRLMLRNARLSLWLLLRLVLRSPAAVAGYAVLGGVATLAVLLAARCRASLPEGNAALALFALAVGQGVLWIRLAFQVAGTRFAAVLVERTTPAAVDLPPAERSMG